MIIALLIKLIFGGPSDLIYIPKLQKYANAYIQEDSRLDQVKEISKSTKKTRKTFDKEYKKLSKELKELNASYFTSAEDFNNYKTDLQANRNKISAFEIERYLSFNKLILDNEWKQIIESSANDFKKRRKNGNKAKKEFDKQIDKLLAEFDKQIGDKAKSEKAKEIIYSFQKEMEILANKQNQYSMAYNTELQNKRFNKEELQQLCKEDNLVGDNMFELFIQTHDNLLKLASEEEWNAIGKQMNKLF